MINKIKKLILKSKYYNKESYLNANLIEEMPIISKEDVLKNYNDIFVPSKHLKYVFTSGSTGMPLKIPWKQNDYINSMMSLWRLRERYGVVSSDTFIKSHMSYFYKNERVDNPVLIGKNYISLSKMCYSRDIMEKYIKQIGLFSPKWVHAQPSFIYHLGKYINDSNSSVFEKIKYIELVGEMLTPELKHEIKSMFPNAIVVNMYGMQEFNGVMFESNGLMKGIDDNVGIEILRRDGSPCDIDEEGEIVVTGLKNSCFPLVRYKTNDLGKKVIRNDNVMYEITSGRSNDSFQYNKRTYDGSMMFVIINEYNMRNKAQISRFQVIYDGNKFEFKVFSFDELPQSHILQKEFEKIFFNIMKEPVNLSVEKTTGESFIEGETKTKYFINKSNFNH